VPAVGVRVLAGLAVLAQALVSGRIRQGPLHVPVSHGESFLLRHLVSRKTCAALFPGIFPIHILIHRLWLVIRI
jgi:hypothetical protein